MFASKSILSNKSLALGNKFGLKICLGQHIHPIVNPKRASDCFTVH